MQNCLGLTGYCSGPRSIQHLGQYHFLYATRNLQAQLKYNSAIDWRPGTPLSNQLRSIILLTAIKSSQLQNWRFGLVFL
ncbi:MAG: hypothetical protein JKY95_04480 [Planctomycetaceae bacterium]|nr:hypothetical protein [Planctomycetaceae bacterium]